MRDGDNTILVEGNKDGVGSGGDDGTKPRHCGGDCFRWVTTDGIDEPGGIEDCTADDSFEDRCGFPWQRTRCLPWKVHTELMPWLMDTVSIYLVEGMG